MFVVLVFAIIALAAIAAIGPSRFPEAQGD